MLKKYIVILLLSLGVFPALCMDAPLKLAQNQAIDDELVTVELQGGQLFKVQAQHAKLSQTLSNLIDDVGTDGILPIPNVNPEIWSKIVALMPHLLDITLEAANQQTKEQIKTTILETLQTYDAAALVEFIKAVNFLDIRLLTELAIKAGQKIDIQKITPEQIVALPKEIRNLFLVRAAADIVGPLHCKREEPRVMEGKYCQKIMRVQISDTKNVHIYECDKKNKQILVIEDLAGFFSSPAVIKLGQDRIHDFCVTYDNSKIIVACGWVIRIFDMQGTLIKSWKVETNADDPDDWGDYNASVHATRDNKIIYYIKKDDYDMADGIYVYDMQGNVLNKLKQNCVTAVAELDNTIISASNKGTICFWNNSGINFKTITLYKKNHQEVECIINLAIADNKFVIGCASGMIYILDREGTELTSWQASRSPHYDGLIVTPSLKIISWAFNYSPSICIWDMEGNCLGMCHDERKSAHGACLQSESKIFSLHGNEGFLQPWDISAIDCPAPSNNTQAAFIWEFLQKIKVLKDTGNPYMKVDGEVCWKQIKELMEKHKDASQVQGQEPETKRLRLDD